MAMTSNGPHRSVKSFAQVLPRRNTRRKAIDLEDMGYSNGYGKNKRGRTCAVETDARRKELQLNTHMQQKREEPRLNIREEEYTDSKDEKNHGWIQTGSKGETCHR